MIPVLVTMQDQSVPETLHVHEQEKEVFGLYKTISNLALDLNESSVANQKELIELVKRQLDLCKTIPENVKDDTRTATTHLPQYSQVILRRNIADVQKITLNHVGNFNVKHAIALFSSSIISGGLQYKN